MVMTDDRCSHRSCTSKGMYRMVGVCRNCGTEDVLMLFTEGHEKRNGDCPTCGVRDSVMPQRLATEDEIPVAFEIAIGGKVNDE